MDSELTESNRHGIEVGNGGTIIVNRTTILRSQLNGVRAAAMRLEILGSTVSESVDVGIHSTSASTAIHRSLIFKNDLGGVLSTSGVFDLTNNFVYENGNGGTANFGGLKLISQVGGNRVQHNTVAFNLAAYNAANVTTTAGGIFCQGGGSAANNLVVANWFGNEEMSNSQTAGTCSMHGSYIANYSTGLGFKEVGFATDLHLTNANSPVVNAGVAVEAPLADDFDGDLRSDGQPDVGADELVP